jgi:alkylresorcinol/alkylpyrone synthase
MQRVLSRRQVGSDIDPRLNVEILSVATANPKGKYTQAEAFEGAKAVFPQFARMDALYLNASIDTRHSCVPADWCQTVHSWEERTEIYQREALVLLEEVSVKAIAEAGLVPADIDMIVINTITGLAVPSLEAKLMNVVDFRPTVQRLPIFGYGCGGGAGGLARAAQLAHAHPGSNVLLLTVELCTLCARPNDPSLTMFVAAALFADGAGAVVLRSPVGGAEDGQPAAARSRPRVRAVGEHSWRGTERLLGWDIKNDGFGMVLSPDLPGHMRRSLRPAVEGFLEHNGIELEALTGYLFHPGGRKVLEAAEDAMPLERDQLRHSWSVLRDYGNMSSATVMFILKRAMEAGDKGPQLMAAFGPGFTAYFVVIDL